ncbi:hypothetical protein PMF13cell1_02187 [Blautia producta]|uniref:Uncharacterized protein n=1 Tax=Blautia producta TaxID=33035 RepID=A0A4P6LZE6_9FIRM|nr:hypothetical protein [Blautia producta]QBE96640.1 hypothetical protein PMF13cell1_02187 [Blautia producta]
MSLAIVDNATLTAVQRLLGEIPIKYLQTVDGDILAFETFIQAILFFDDVCYIDDYKSEYLRSRDKYFSHLGKISIQSGDYDALLAETVKYADNTIPEIKGGFFTDSDFKAFFDLLKMHNVFTWDMASSIYYLTQKMLLSPSGELDINKYSILNQMIFNEMSDTSVMLPREEKSKIVDSKGNPISKNYTVIDWQGFAKEAYLGENVKKLIANLSWLAYRTIFYTLAANQMKSSLILHPIRNAFQINFLAKLNSKRSTVFKTIISAMNAPVEAAVDSIYSATQPLVTKYPLPMFSILLTQQSGSPKKAIDAAYHLKYEGAFVEARRKLAEIENLYETHRTQKAIQDANKLVLDVNRLMEKICNKYHITTSQGISLSPMITIYNMGAAVSDSIFPTIPDFSAKLKFLDGVRNLVPQHGFNAVYKSLINDLTQIERLGEYHELLTSEIKCHQDAHYYTAKTEEERFRNVKTYWKVPM